MVTTESEIGGRHSEAPEPSLPQKPRLLAALMASVLVILVFAVAVLAGGTFMAFFEPLFSAAAIVCALLVIELFVRRYRSATIALPLCGVVMLGGNSLGTQFVAQRLQYVRDLGEPIVRIGEVQIFSPLAWTSWVEQFGPPSAPLTFMTGMSLSYGGLLAAVVMMLHVHRVCNPTRPGTDMDRASNGRSVNTGYLELAGLLLLAQLQLQVCYQSQDCQARAISYGAEGPHG